MFKKLFTCIYCAVALIGTNVYAFDVDDFDQVKGYTVVDVTYVLGTFDGADYDRLIELDNGMIFKFTEYKYHYAYRPPVVVFGEYYSIDEARKLYPQATTSVTLYKLLIDDDFYDVDRVK